VSERILNASTKGMSVLGENLRENITVKSPDARSTIHRSTKKGYTYTLLDMTNDSEEDLEDVACHLGMKEAKPPKRFDHIPTSQALCC